MPDIDHLFDEWAARYARGERPDPREYLSQAGVGASELARLMDAFVRQAPRAEPREEDIALVRAAAANEPPLLELRRRRGLRRDEIVDALITRLDLDPTKRDKVKGYYHRLESGLLDVAGVSDRVFEVLGDSLGDRVRELASWEPRRAAGTTAFLRADAAVGPSAYPEGGVREADEPDEVDSLFLFGLRSADNSGRGRTGH